jgi:Tfp pilus assembly protein PilN
MNALNLLPWSFRRRMLLRVRLGQWLMITAAACIAVLAIAGLRFFRISRKSDTLDRLQARCASLEAMKSEAQRVEARVAESHRLEALLSRVENQELPLLAVGLVSRVVGRSEGRIQVQSIALGRALAAVPVPEKPGTTVNEETISLMLNGRGADNLAVADMVLRLRETGVFDTVTLKPAASAVESQGPQFQVECLQRTRRL